MRESVIMHDKEELKKQAQEFFKANGRPPKTKELNTWRTILRRWKGRGSWNGFLDETGIPSYEVWEREQRIKALKTILCEYGELTQKEYNSILSEKLYPYLPDILTINRMFKTCELGKNGAVWEIIRNNY